MSVTAAAPEKTGPPAEPGLGQRVLNRVAGANTVTVTLLAVLLALVVGAVLIVLSNPEVAAEYGYFFAAPGTVLGDSWQIVADAYTQLFEGSVLDPAAVSGALDGANSWSLVFAPISETLTYTAPLIFTGLAVALAFRGGLFNIGAQGQAIMGCCRRRAGRLRLPLPPGLHLVAALLGAAVFGALWAGIAGVLKARTGAHEVIVTIMLNYIALYFLQLADHGEGRARPEPYRRDQQEGRRKLPAAPARQQRPAGQPRHRARGPGRRRGRLAAPPLHGRLRAARGGRQPGRRPDRRDERRAARTCW